MVEDDRSFYYFVKGTLQDLAEDELPRSLETALGCFGSLPVTCTGWEHVQAVLLPASASRRKNVSCLVKARAQILEFQEISRQFSVKESLTLILGFGVELKNCS